MKKYFRMTKACYSTLTDKKCRREVNKICQNLENMSTLRRKPLFFIKYILGTKVQAVIYVLE